jgi:hypothetical protein
LRPGPFFWTYSSATAFGKLHTAAKVVTVHVPPTGFAPLLRPGPQSGESTVHGLGFAGSQMPSVANVQSPFVRHPLLVAMLHVFQREQFLTAA